MPASGTFWHSLFNSYQVFLSHLLSSLLLMLSKVSASWLATEHLCTYGITLAPAKGDAYSMS